MLNKNYDHKIDKVKALLIMLMLNSAVNKLLLLY